MSRITIGAILLVICCIFSGFSNVEAARQKSAVLLVFNDQSGRDNGERLVDIAHEELGKKINGIYNVIDNRRYEEKYSATTHFDDSLKDIELEAMNSAADYFVYVELMPFRQAEGFNVIWHRKKMVACIGLRIIDLKNDYEIFKDVYSVEKTDDTDFFFVGSSSMARKSLKGALYITGEAISVNLPL